MSWPRKPPKDARCDAHTGVGEDQTGKPVVYRCKNEAVETCVDGLGHEVWLCESCAPILAEKKEVKRNPRMWADADRPEVGK